jgi:hypothetical protein
VPREHFLGRGTERLADGDGAIGRDISQHWAN